MPNVKLTETKKKAAPNVAQKQIPPQIPAQRKASVADTSQQIREDKLKRATNVFVFRLDANGERNYLAQYPYPLAEGLIIEGLLQQLHGAGRYRIEYRNSKGQIVTTDEPLGIEGLPNVNASMPQPQQQTASYGGLPMTPQGIEALVKTVMQQSKPVEPSLDQLLQTAKLLKELNGSSAPQKSLIEQVKELRELERLVAPKVEVKPVAEPDPTFAVLKMLTSNPETARTIQTNLGALFTGENPLPEKETSIADMFGKLIDNFGPLLMPMLANAMNNAQPTQQQAGQVAPSVNVSPGTQTATITPTENTGQPTLPANYVHIINRILFGIDRGLKPDFIAEEIDILQEQDQTLIPIIDAMVNTSPEQLLQGLAAFSPQAAQVCQLPHALQFATEFLECFNEEEPEQPENGAPVTQPPATEKAASVASNPD